MLKNILVFVIVFSAFGCTNTNLKEGWSDAISMADLGEKGRKDGEDQPEFSRSDKAYYFQHRLIPSWVYQSEGGFFRELSVKNISRLAQAAGEIVDQEYANGLEIRPVENADAVLIVFPEPDRPPLCYYALVLRASDKYRYITYESTHSLNLNDGVYGVVGGWNESLNHENYGGRQYKSAEDFVKDIISTME